MKMRLLCTVAFCCALLSDTVWGRGLPCVFDPISSFDEMPAGTISDVHFESDSITIFQNADAYEFDLSRPGNPRLVDHYQRAITPDLIHNGLAFLDLNGRLYIYDYTDPRAPQQLVEYNTVWTTFRDMEARDSSLFIANDTSHATRNGLIVLDISDPSNPVETARFEGAYDANDMAISGDLLLLPTSDRGLAVFDIAVPSQPTLLAHKQAMFGANIAQIRIEGDIAYLQIGQTDIACVDLSDPTNPSLLDEIETDRIVEFGQANGWVFTLDPSRTVRLFDVRNL